MKRVLTVAVFSALALMFGYNVKNFLLTYRDPYVDVKTSAIDELVKSGGILRARFEFDHIRICEEKLARFIIRRDDTNEVVYRDSVAGGATNLGHHTVTHPIQIPHELGPGPYYYRVIIHAQCSDGQHDQPTPDIPFDIN